MSLFDLQDVCMVIGSPATLDLPMVVDLIEIFESKGPYCTLTMIDCFLQALSVMPRGSWGDVVRRFTMIRWVWLPPEEVPIRIGFGTELVGLSAKKSWAYGVEPVGLTDCQTGWDNRFPSRSRGLPARGEVFLPEIFLEEVFLQEVMSPQVKRSSCKRDLPGRGVPARGDVTLGQEVFLQEVMSPRVKRSSCKSRGLPVRGALSSGPELGQHHDQLNNLENLNNTTGKENNQAPKGHGVKPQYGEQL
ncbi:hypothetical protein F511_37234 [Dorcoceras hygrometricum]|uniref:Uncharacterized protein n=1 Tax=Dorcoceras hygrometricum TaxID=472368 RepID=A0A2Z7D2C2_9LAMI|nr:hypothetical protein F511_37234 [Dorcoceras hygrometricum]